VTNAKIVFEQLKYLSCDNMIMSVLNCRYYGFECNYEMDGDIKTMANEFKNHIKKEHMIDYPKEILTNVILRKKP
jgi:predicted small metal-binding protein